MGSTLVSKEFPGFSSIYVLNEAGNSIAFRGEFFMSGGDEWAVTRAEKSPGPVVVRHAMGRTRPSDIIHTTLVAPLLISDRVVSILKAGGFSGWRTYPIDLFGKDGIRIPNYQGLAVHGRCGPIDESRAVRLDKIYPAGIRPAWYGLYFDPATWDGSDVFMTSSQKGWIFMVEAVKRAFEKAKLTNMKFTALPVQHVPRLK